MHCVYESIKGKKLKKKKKKKCKTEPKKEKKKLYNTWIRLTAYGELACK